MPNAAAGNSISSSAQIVDGIIDTADIKDSAVTTGKIADGTIVNNDINAAAAIVDTKLATISTAGKVDGAALTGLANIPAGAGNIPAANLTNAGDPVVFINPGEIYAASGTTPLNNGAGTSAGFCMVLPDASGNELYAQIRVPPGRTSISSIKVVHSCSVNSGNVSYSMRTAKRDGITGGAATVDSTETMRQVAVPGTVGTTSVLTINSDSYDALGAVAGGDIMSVNLIRYGSDGNDTAAGSWYIHGIIITFA